MGRHSRPSRLRHSAATAAHGMLVTAVAVTVTGLTWGRHSQPGAAGPTSQLRVATPVASPAAATEPATPPVADVDQVPPTRVAARTTSRTKPRLPLIPGCAPTVDTVHPNGELPADAVCRLPGRDDHLRGDAALAFVRLDAAYRARFDRRMCLTDSYRSYAGQQYLYAIKPGLAAVPGTSKHGEGIAIDLCGGAEVPGSEAYAWLTERGHEFGWANPSWARPGGSRPEPWHWEFTPRR